MTVLERVELDVKNAEKELQQLNHRFLNSFSMDTKKHIDYAKENLEFRKKFMIL